MGTPTISIAIFSSKLLVYQRGWHMGFVWKYGTPPKWQFSMGKIGETCSDHEGRWSNMAPQKEKPTAAKDSPKLLRRFASAKLVKKKSGNMSHGRFPYIFNMSVFDPWRNHIAIRTKHRQIIVISVMWPENPWTLRLCWDDPWLWSGKGWQADFANEFWAKDFMSNACFPLGQRWTCQSAFTRYHRCSCNTNSVERMLGNKRFNVFQ